jgi:outer membrane protein assembly factor BamB
MDPALSSFSISAGRAFTQARRAVGGQQREFVIALDARTGDELWAEDLDRAFYPNGGVGLDDGPRSTPVVDGDRVYTLTSYLRLFSRDAPTGNLVWMRDFPAELGAEVIEWQNAASPLVVGDLIFINANVPSRRLMAIRKDDGSIAWSAHDDPMTQATPVAATIAGVPQVIFFTQSGLVSVRPETGERLWDFPMWRATSTAASPVVADDLVFCSAAYASGSGVVRIRAEGNGLAATELWKEIFTHQAHWATPVQHEGKVYGVIGASLLTLRCIDLESGEGLWDALDRSSGHYIGYGSVLKAGGYLLAVSATGRVAVAELDPAAYREIDHFQALEGNGKCWNNAAIDDGILYVRSTLEAAAWEIGPAGPGPEPGLLRLTTAPAAGDTFRVRAVSEDDEPLDAARMARLRLLTSTNAALPAAQWMELNLSPSLDAGGALFETPVAAGERERYFLLSEGP